MFINILPWRAAAVVAIVVIEAGAVASATGTTVPEGAAAGCAEITAALDGVEAFGFAFATGDLETLAAVIDALPDLAAGAADAAPEDISETVETWVAPFPLIAAALAEIDLSDPDAFEQAVIAVDTGASETARGEVEAWAEFNCGWTSSLDVDQIEAPEPADCEDLDAAAAAEAAGLDIDVTDLDGSADVNLPGFWTKSCSYGNGALSVSTFGFNAIEDAQRFYADNLARSDGVILDVPIGTLPASSLVLQTGVSTGTTTPGTDDTPAVPPSVQVAVFEAPTPFSVTLPGADIDPAAVVAAAEAVLAAQSGEAERPTTDATTTA